MTCTTELPDYLFQKGLLLRDAYGSIFRIEGYALIDDDIDVTIGILYTKVINSDGTFCNNSTVYCRPAKNFMDKIEVNEKLCLRFSPVDITRQSVEIKG